MTTYAMICKNIVIDILHDQEVEPKWPPTQFGDEIIAVACSDEVTTDWLYNPETGELYEPKPYVPEPIVSEPTQLDTIEESQLIIMEALAEQYELNEERHIDDLEIKAEIYEAILELGGNV